MAIDKKSKLQLACKVIELRDKEPDHARAQASKSAPLVEQQRQKKRKRPDTETAEYLQKIKREFHILKDLKQVNGLSHFANANR